MKNQNDVVIIELDRPRELRYGHKALKTLVALTGLSLEEIEQAPLTDLGYLEKVVYCGLLNDAKKNVEELKLEDMEDLLDHVEKYADIFALVQQAFAVSFSIPGEAHEGNQVGE